MGDNKISEAVVRLACDAYDKIAQWGDVTNEFEAMNAALDAALDAALPHLQGEAVPVAWLIDWPDEPDLGHYFSESATDQGRARPLYLHPQPAELSEVPPELAEAIAAGNGTLHGAIDYWQDRALAAEAKLSEVSGDSGELDERQSAWNDSARLACLESWAREPGGLLLHAESGTGRRGLGLGENCGRRTLAKAIDSCATHAEKDSFAALAATGKQQVGEVQGDALVDTARRNIRQFISKASFSSSVDKQAALSCVDVLEAALASRQPVGQVPAGWKLVPELASEEQLRAALDTGVYHDGEDSARAVLADEYRTMVAAAPPVQSIDLGQFRGWLCSTPDGAATDWTVMEDSRARFERLGRTIEPVFAAGRLGQSTRTDHLLDRRNRLMNSYGNGDREDAAIDAQIAQVDAELALLDGRDAGAGVDE